MTENHSNPSKNPIFIGPQDVSNALAEARKEAHNAAIDKAIKIVAETRCRDSVHEELEKLKL